MLRIVDYLVWMKLLSALEINDVTPLYVAKRILKPNSIYHRSKPFCMPWPSLEDGAFCSGIEGSLLA
jgi:hypothetical protein